MFKDVSDLKAAYNHFRWCKRNQAQAVLTGAYNEAFNRIFKELNALFAENNEREE